MTLSSFSTPGADEALIALAILARADAVMLADVAGLNLAAQDLAGLAAHSAVQTSGSTFTLDPETASEVLTALERDDLPGYRTRHERALTVLLAGVQAGMETAEPILMTVFERLANRLLMDDPQRLIELVEQMEDVPWQTAVGAQRRRYFKGVALRKAERYHDSLAVFDALLTEPELDVTIRGRTLNSRAICYRLIGRLEEALTDYRASLALWRQLDDSQYEGAVLLNMGIIAYELQNYDDAEDNLRQAAGIFTKIGSLWRLAVVQNELGIVYRDQGRWAESLACFETYVAQRQADGADDSVGRGLNNLGEVLLFQGRFAEAIAALQKAIEKMSTHVYQIDTHLHLGLAYQATGKLEQAYAAFQRALKLAEAINRREILPHVHYRLGDVLLRQGAGSDALAQFEAAAEVIESTREPIRDEGLKISLLGRWQQVYEALVLMHVDNGRFQEAFLWAERARARAFAEAIVAGEDGGEQGSRGAGGQGGVVTAAAMQAVLPADGVALCYFTTGVLARDIPLLQAIPADNPLREHLLTPARTILFVITKQRLAAYHCPIDPNLFTMVSPRGHDPNRLLETAVLQHLHQTLLGFTDTIRKARQLFMIPHGPLHHVPFAALLNKNRQPLARTGGPMPAYAPSATLLQHGLASAPGFGEDGSCLAVGYNGIRGRRPLQYTEAEVMAVARLMDGEAWTGQEAKKEKLRQAAAQQRWLHLACHGWFNHENPMSSYLETGSGERLTAQEVIESWQLQAELVTLSACQTGVSRILRGDEPMGLVRAFLYAGARAVIVSQWAVEDLPTCLFMMCFYQMLREDSVTDFSAALQQAQQWLRELTATQVKEAITSLATIVEEPEWQATIPEGKRPFAHPRYWAAFQLVGRPEYTP